MSIIRYFEKIRFMDSLIYRKATGNQKEFSRKVGLSRSTLNDYLSEMKKLGFPICFCKKRNSYFYEENGRMVGSLFEKEITEKEMKTLRGGLHSYEELNIDISSCNIFFIQHYKKNIVRI